VIVVVELQAELKPETTWSEMRHGPDQFFFYRIGGRTQSGSAEIARYVNESRKVHQCIAAFHDKGQTRVAAVTDLVYLAQVWLIGGPANCLVCRFAFR